jgi:hypothetical protein
MSKIAGKHWLYGEVKLEKVINEESDCVKCTHIEVCNRDKSKNCENYLFGTSEYPYQNCMSCSHRFTRFTKKDEEKISCFCCKYFKLI